MKRINEKISEIPHSNSLDKVINEAQHSNTKQSDGTSLLTRIQQIRANQIKPQTQTKQQDVPLWQQVMEIKHTEPTTKNEQKTEQNAEVNQLVPVDNNESDLKLEMLSKQDVQEAVNNQTNVQNHTKLSVAPSEQTKIESKRKQLRKSPKCQEQLDVQIIIQPNNKLLRCNNTFTSNAEEEEQIDNQIEFKKEDNKQLEENNEDQELNNSNLPQEEEQITVIENPIPTSPIQNDVDILKNWVKNQTENIKVIVKSPEKHVEKQKQVEKSQESPNLEKTKKFLNLEDIQTQKIEFQSLNNKNLRQLKKIFENLK